MSDIDIDMNSSLPFFMLNRQALLSLTLITYIEKIKQGVKRSYLDKLFWTIFKKRMKKKQEEFLRKAKTKG